MKVQGSKPREVQLSFINTPFRTCTKSNPVKWFSQNSNTIVTFEMRLTCWNMFFHYSWGKTRCSGESQWFLASTAILGLKAQSTNISPRSTQQWPVMVPYKSWIWWWVLMKCKLMRFSFCLKVCGGIIDDSKQLSCLLLLNHWIRMRKLSWK